MKIGRNRFNIYLLLTLALILPCGCRTRGDDKDKVQATLRVHVEVVPASMDFSTTVPVYREKPVMVTVDKSPFVTEADVESAKVVDVRGGFDLQIQFDRRGTWLLEEYTTTNPGKHFAVFSEFGVKKSRTSRWLAAPIIYRRISNGILRFTPDATREEAEKIALGLNNVAKKVNEASKW